jgi:hypothetical protein
LNRKYMNYGDFYPKGFFVSFGTAISLTTGPFKKPPGNYLKYMFTIGLPPIHRDTRWRSREQISIQYRGIRDPSFPTRIRDLGMYRCPPGFSSWIDLWMLKALQRITVDPAYRSEIDLSAKTKTTLSTKCKVMVYQQRFTSHVLGANYRKTTLLRDWDMNGRFLMVYRK